MLNLAVKQSEAGLNRGNPVSYVVGVGQQCSQMKQAIGNI